MFTGIIEEMGVIQALDRGPKSARLTVMARTVMNDLAVGDSITVDGVCLTVTTRTEEGFSSDLSPETLTVTHLGTLAAGDAVNLERAVRFNGRMGGHLVSGHIDGVGRIRGRRQEEDALFLSIELPKELMRYCVKKGSITVDGISLTINHMADQSVEVAVIPHTAKVTTLGLKGIGSPVNLECDLIGKYVERLLDTDQPPSRITAEYLKKKGLL